MSTYSIIKHHIQNVKTLVKVFITTYTSNMKMNSKDFVFDIVTHLTGAEPVVDLVEDEHGAVITITPKGNVSALIGRSGTTIDSIRTLCKAIGYNGKHRIKVKLDEQDRHPNRD